MYIQPQPGPQRMFAECSADICLYVGQPGSGKTGALVFELGRWCRVKHYTGVAFRRDHKQLVGGGSLWDLSKKWFPYMGARMPEHVAHWDDTHASVEYHHLHLESDKTNHDGKEYALECFDELPHFTASQFWYLALLRNRSTCGVRPYVRASAMATPDTWVHELVKPWLHPDGWPNHEMSGVIRWFVRDDASDGVLWFDERAHALEHVFHSENRKRKPKSFTVIHALTADNKILLASDPNYESNVANMTLVERLRMEGCWEARPPSAGMFERAWFRVHDRIDPSQVKFSVRGWDKAATKRTENTGLYSDDPDWTRGVLLHVLRSGEVVVADVQGVQDRPAKVDDLYRSTAEMDGPKVTQAFWTDPAQAGLVDEEHTRQQLAKVRGCGPVSFHPVARTKVKKYAEPCAAYAGPETEGRIGILRGTWNGAFFSEIEQFPLEKDAQGNKIHDDQVSAMARAWIEAAKYLPLTKTSDWAAKMRASK